MSVSLLVPLAQPNDPTREAHWSWLRARWEATLPASWSICEGRAPAEPWIKAHAALRASELALPGVWIILDADVLLEPDVLIEAAHLVESGQTRWVHPHRRFHRLGPGTTERIVDTHPAADLDFGGDREKPACPSSPGGGCVVVASDAFTEVGGFDPRFTGWSKEDINLGRALGTLVGHPVELGAEMWHLWHPPQLLDLGGRPQRRRMKADEKPLNARYREAVDRPDLMRALVAEHQEVTTCPS